MKEAMASVSQSSAVYGNTAGSLAMFVVDVDEKEYIATTTRLEQMFGYEPGELVGKCIEQLVPEDRWTPHLQHVTNFLDAPVSRMMGHRAMKIEGQRKDGTVFPVEIELFDYRTVAGKHLITGLVFDMTARVALALEKLSESGGRAAGV